MKTPPGDHIGEQRRLQMCQNSTLWFHLSRHSCYNPELVSHLSQIIPSLPVFLVAPGSETVRPDSRGGPCTAEMQPVDLWQCTIGCQGTDPSADKLVAAENMQS